jgi:L-ascorbate metabolism protein UlaG (beta-lactamase superfamily)
MKLKWYGHASFRVTAEDGTTVITDPYTPEITGYAPIPDGCEVVIMSSDNDRSHCRADLIRGQPTVINALEVAQSDGAISAGGIDFFAIKSMEALDHRYHDPDQNALYRFAADGISVGHMGDVGNPLNDDQIAFFKNVDVLLALTGGHPTIELDDLKTIIDRVQPRLVVPMHFQTLRYKPRNLLWIESFLEYFDSADVDFVCDTEAVLTAESLPGATRVLVLAHVC